VGPLRPNELPNGLGCVFRPNETESATAAILILLA
jgi:hypothetical protein